MKILISCSKNVTRWTPAIYAPTPSASPTQRLWDPYFVKIMRTARISLTYGGPSNTNSNKKD